MCAQRDFEARYLNLVWFLWWTSLYRMLTIFALGFVMFVPNVGKTTSIPDLFSQMTISLQCVFQGVPGLQGCCARGTELSFRNESFLFFFPLPLRTARRLLVAGLG